MLRFFTIKTNLTSLFTNKYNFKNLRKFAKYIQILRDTALSLPTFRFRNLYVFLLVILFIMDISEIYTLKKLVVTKESRFV